MNKAKLTKILHQRKRLSETRLEQARQNMEIRRKALQDTDQQIAAIKSSLDTLLKARILKKPDSPDKYIEIRDQISAIRQTLQGVVTLRRFLATDFRRAESRRAATAQNCLRANEKERVICARAQSLTADTRRRMDAKSTEDYTQYAMHRLRETRIS